LALAEEVQEFGGVQKGGSGRALKRVELKVAGGRKDTPER